MHYSFAILKNESDADHKGWVKACERSENPIKYKIIDITKLDWLEQSTDGVFDYFLARPPGATSHFKQLFDERVYILYAILGKNIYPTYNEIVIYENKRMLAYFLQANNIPHPKTWIFYHRDEAYGFLDDCVFPIVAKTTIGASGSGTAIFRHKKVLRRYIDNAFSKKGLKRRWGPNLRRGDLTSRFVSRLKNLPQAYDYFHEKYSAATMSTQRWYVLLQEYVRCDYEWRAVRIGDSYFAHKKMRRGGEFFSGTSQVDWVAPPRSLLEFVKYVCDKGQFYSQAVDLFEYKRDQFMVNELQCFFGSKNPHQMKLDGKPGRFRYRGGDWVFEQGDFNVNDSFDLRLEHVINLIKEKDAA